MWLKLWNLSMEGQKTESKGENAFSSFPSMFSKGFSVRIFEIQDCVVKNASKNILRKGENAGNLHFLF